MASSPVRASPATSMSTRPAKTCFRPMRTTSWSTIRRRIIPWLTVVVIVVPITARRPGKAGVGGDGFRCRTNPTSGNVVLEGVPEEDAVALDGYGFTAKSRKVRHVVAGGRDLDASGAWVVAD